MTNYPQQPYSAPQPTGTNSLAIAALILAFVFWPAGLILGFVAKSQIKQTGEGGDGLATAAIVIGIVAAVLVACGIAALFASV